jgi:hypothetical protein
MPRADRAIPPPADGRGRQIGAGLLALYLALAAYLVPVFPHGASANELTRWATTASLVERGSFEISWTEPLIGPIVDTARVGDRVYSNKAPGVAVLAVPAYWLARAVAGPPTSSNVRLSWTLMRWMAATLPLLLLAYWLWRRGTAPVALAAVLFATPLFLYSLLLFSHVLAAVTLYFAYHLLFGEQRQRASLRHLGAGALAGLAVLSEFPAVVPVIVFALGLVLDRARTSRDRAAGAAWFVTGGLPFAVALFWYNAAIFGSPLSFSYEHEAYAEWAAVASQGLFGIGWPTPAKIWLLWFSPARGLFFYTPLLLLSAAWLVRRPTGARDLRKTVRLAAVVATLVIVAGHGAAHGGWAAGARYLVLVLPLMLEPLTEVQESAYPRALTGVLFACSLWLSLLPALTFPFAPPEFGFPHTSFWWELLVNERWVTPTLGAAMGLGSGWLGLAPALVCLIAIFVLTTRASARPRSFFAGLVAGSVIVAGYVVLPDLDERDGPFRRASIAERFFRPADRLARFERDATMRSDLNELRRIAAQTWMVADARGVAPDDWPYALASPLVEGPASRLRRAQALAGRGDLTGAEAVLRAAGRDLPFARCEVTANLAVIAYARNRKDVALEELETGRATVARAASADCARVLFLLASLYQESGRAEDARVAFTEYLRASEGLTDADTLAMRQQAARALQAR